MKTIILSIAAISCLVAFNMSAAKLLIHEDKQKKIYTIIAYILYLFLAVMDWYFILAVFISVTVFYIYKLIRHSGYLLVDSYEKEIEERVRVKYHSWYKPFCITSAILTLAIFIF